MVIDCFSLTLVAIATFDTMFLTDTSLLVPSDMHKKIGMYAACVAFNCTFFSKNELEIV